MYIVAVQVKYLRINLMKDVDFCGKHCKFLEKLKKTRVNGQICPGFGLENSTL